MAEREINVGERAHSKDGKDIGEVEAMIINTDTGEVHGFVLDRRLFADSKIVDIGLVTSTDQEGVRLSINADEADALPSVLTKQLIRAPGSLSYSTGMGGIVDIAGTGDQWMVQGAGGGLPSTGSSSLYMQAPMGNVETRNVSSLPDDAVLISEGTDVIGADGKKIGHVDEIFIDEHNRVTSILVKAGFLFKHDIEIPVSQISSATHEHVRLKLDTDQVGSKD